MLSEDGPTVLRFDRTVRAGYENGSDSDERAVESDELLAPLRRGWSTGACAMSPESSLSIIVVNYASSQLLERNLVKVGEAAPDAEVLVVDNHTTDAERRRVRALAEEHGWTVLVQSENLGFGGGVNRGVIAARERGRTRHLLLNPDASIDGASVRLLLDAVAADVPTIAAPVVTDGAGRVWSAGHVLDLADGATHGPRWVAAHPEAKTRPWLTAAVLMINDAAWEITDGFDEEYFLYWEDVDFSRRVVSAGGSLALVEEARAVHDEGGTQRAEPETSRAKSEGYYYYNIRNRMLYAVRHLDDAAVQRWRRSIPRTAREVILRGGRRQLIQSAAPIRAYLRGVREARRIARSHATVQKGRKWS